MLRVLENIRNGTLAPAQLVSAESTQRASGLDINKHRDMQQVHVGSVNSIDIEIIEGRYLLSAGSSGTVAIHDLDNVNGSLQYTCNVVAKADKKTPDGHQFSVETVQWYPCDTGMFTSSGMDKYLKVWDTNTMKPAENFRIDGRISQHHMSSIATKHCLIAVARSGPTVVLVDIKSGAAIQELRGHRKSVLSIQWSSRDEFLLAAGGDDGRVILWDVRRAKSILRNLDMHNGEQHASSSKGRTDISLAGAKAHEGQVNGLRFTQDGHHLITYATEHRLRLWNMWTGRREDVNFGKTYNDSRKSVQIDVTTNTKPGIVYVPSEGNIHAYELQTGTKINTLRGHFDSVNCCKFHPFYQELYSGASDRNILVWTADHDQTSAYDEFLRGATCEEMSGGNKIKRTNMMADAWSSDEES